jgi:hypothetical protein
MPEAPEASPEPAEPERKRRRRRGIRDQRLSLNEDVMNLVIPKLCKASMRHVFILSMVNKELRAAIMDNHEMWETEYRVWERRQVTTVPGRSLGSDFTARCFQAMPRWMMRHVPAGQLLSRHRPHRSLPQPYARAVLGNDWRSEGVPDEMRPSFERYAKKVLRLWHVGCCGCCGTRQGKQRAIWTLNMRVCRGCWLANVVSNRTLLQDYGIDVLKPLRKDGPRLSELIRNRVFYIRNFMPPSAREKYTQALADFPDGKSCVSIWLFWRPHLEQIVNLGERRAEYQAKRAAGEALACVLRRRYALLLRDHYESKQRPVRVKRVCHLRHNEINRMRQTRALEDPIEDWHNTAQRQLLADFADRLPSPDNHPLRFTDLPGQ